MKPLAGRCLLVADKDAAALGCWRERLLGQGARVICSSSIDSALANAIAFPAGTFDAAVIEHRPPRLDAVELAGSLRALPSMNNLPVIVVAAVDAAPFSTNDSPQSVVMPRPVDAGQLADRLSRMLGQPSVPGQGRGSSSPAPAPCRSSVLVAQGDPVNAQVIHPIPAMKLHSASGGQCEAVTAVGPIDWSQVESLHLVDPQGANGLVGKAIGLYIDHAPKLIEEILTYRVTGDLKYVKRAAHSLKSSSASLGANTVAGLSKTIEVAAAKGDFEIIDSVVAMLQSEYRRAESELRKAAG